MERSVMCICMFWSVGAMYIVMGVVSLEPTHGGTSFARYVWFPPSYDLLNLRVPGLQLPTADCTGCDPPHSRASRCVSLGKGQNGVSTNEMGSLQLSCFGRKDFLGTPVNLLLSPPKCQGVPFSPICQHSLLLQQPH